MTKKEFRGIVAGMVLGDGNLQVQRKAINPCIRFNHSSKQREYAKHKIVLLQPKFHYDLRKGYAEKEVYNHQNGKKYKVCTFASRVNSKLKTVWKAAYQGKKVITRQLLDMLTPHGIALWYMDDGYMNEKIVMISMYTEYEQVLQAQKYFQEVWDIQWHIGKHKKSYFLRKGKSSESMVKFRKLIEPYIIPSMRYKIDNIAPDTRTKHVCACGANVSQKRGGQCFKCLYKRYG